MKHSGNKRADNIKVHSKLPPEAARQEAIREARPQVKPVVAPMEEIPFDSEKLTLGRPGDVVRPADDHVPEEENFFVVQGFKPVEYDEKAAPIKEDDYDIDDDGDFEEEEPEVEEVLPVAVKKPAPERRPVPENRPAPQRRPSQDRRQAPAKAPSKANKNARPAKHVKKSKKKKRKTGLIVLIIVLLLVAGVGVASYFYLRNNGYKGTYGECTWTLSKDGVMHVSGNGRMEGEFLVSFGIGKPDPATVKEVVIEEGVTYIPDRAFEKMTNLTKVTIPSTVGEIGSGALSRSSSITSIEVSADNATFSSVDGNLYSKDQDELIAYASGKTDSYFEIPETVATIGPEAFDGSANIENVYFGTELQSVGSLAFINCPKLWSFEVNNDNAYFSVSEGTLFDATGSELIRFCPAYSDTQYDFAPNTIKVAPGAFEGCKNLVTVNFSDGLIAIGNSAFYGCTGLVTAEMPESVAYIGDSAFAGCTSLTSSTIPAGITKIPGNMYWGCTSITNIVLPENVTSIGEGAFAMTSISQIDIPVTVDTIGANAFGGCTGLTHVSLPGGIEEVADYTFNKCTALNDVVLPATIKSIGYAAFNGCTSLKTVTLPDSVTSVGDFAFYGCSSLTDITIDTAIASIGKAAFDECSSLANANYAGGQSGWNAVTVADNNRPLLSALKYS